MPVNLRNERRKRGKSARQMADLISAETGIRIHEGTLARAERGVGTPHPNTQLALATFYEFDLLEQWPDEPEEQAA